MMEINYTASFKCAQFAQHEMARYHTPGSIMFVASMSGLMANHDFTSSVYNSSKAAIIQLAKNLAMEWGPQGIRVNSLCPGHILTPMVEQNIRDEPHLEKQWQDVSMLKRISRPDEFGGAAIFLMSEASTFVTGSALSVDGGATAW
jgi:NAD(P)-dependent dehydrogenase (short-subunit alcohol dehydrogenase family)